MEAANSVLIRVMQAKCELPFFTPAGSKADYQIKMLIVLLQDARRGDSFDTVKDKPLECPGAANGSFDHILINNNFHGVCNAPVLTNYPCFIHVWICVCVKDRARTKRWLTYSRHVCAKRDSQKKDKGSISSGQGFPRGRGLNLICIYTYQVYWYCALTGFLLFIGTRLVTHALSCVHSAFAICRCVYAEHGFWHLYACRKWRMTWRIFWNSILCMSSRPRSIETNREREREREMMRSRCTSILCLYAWQTHTHACITSCRVQERFKADTLLKRQPTKTVLKQML